MFINKEDKLDTIINFIKSEKTNSYINQNERIYILEELIEKFKNYSLEIKNPEIIDLFLAYLMN